MNKSEQINELAAALSAAQHELDNAVKDAANPFFKSRYADLASVREALREPFHNHGLAYTQTLDQAEAGVVVETTLLHKSGQWLSGRLTVRPVKDDPQGIGSAITYARRYSLQAIAGIAADDDDGEAACGRPAAAQKPAQKQVQAAAPAAKPAAPAQAPVPGTAEEVLALRPGQQAVIGVQFESIAPPPKGKKMQRVKLAGHKLSYATFHKMETCKPGDQITATVIARETDDGTIWYELSEYTPF